MSDPRVITVILNTNHRDDTLACLDSLRHTLCRSNSVIVLDNNSSDGSLEAVRSLFPEVEVVSLAHNLGYGGNNNVGIELARQRGADWIFVLNEDTILAPDCLTRMLEVGESDGRIGMVGPMVYHHSEPDVIQSAGGKLGPAWEALHYGENERDRGQFDHPHDVDWLSGCSMMVRRACVEHAGALDDRFYYYYDETEWCLRAREYGWRIVQVPAARLWHKGVQREYRPSPNVTYYNTRNHFLMLAKRRAPLKVWLAAWRTTLRTLTSWTVKPRWRAMHEHRNAMWQGALDFVRRRWGMRVA